MADSAAAVKLTAKHKPDVVLLDVRMPDNLDLEALQKIRKAAPNMPVVMWSIYDSPT